MANIGYYYLIPIFGFELSYNTEPIIISIYFLLWAVFTFVYFKNIFLENLSFDRKLWKYVFLLIFFNILTFVFLYSFSTLATEEIKSSSDFFSAYLEILFANEWFFLPKASEVLFQDLLIFVLVVSMYKKYGSIKQVIYIYLALFGSVHLLQLFATNTEQNYFLLIMLGAIMSSFVFPRLILEVKGGFMYVFTIHFLFYVLLSILLHVYPDVSLLQITN